MNTMHVQNGVERFSPLILIPSYNTGKKLYETVRSALSFWTPVWVVVDGSTDHSTEMLKSLFQADPGLRVIVLARNSGKGAAIRHGVEEAFRLGFSHVLTMDADGQHPAPSIPEFMACARSYPNALIIGIPVFDATAPALRVHGRKISNWFANLETLWGGTGDSLFGFRVYPIAPLRAAFQTSSGMKGFDFDPEAAVRIAWAGTPIIHLAAPVIYFGQNEGGVSHFRYVRDNVLLTWMHLRLLLGFLVRLPLLVWRRFRSCPVHGNDPS
ncbi:MAG: glycosyltransferase family 2 protein [Leptospirales bacterium]